MSFFNSRKNKCNKFPKIRYSLTPEQISYVNHLEEILI